VDFAVGQGGSVVLEAVTVSAAVARLGGAVSWVPSPASALAVTGCGLLATAFAGGALFIRK
jgi:hypothetical protein